MPPGEVWWLIEAKLPPEQKGRADDMAELYDLLKKEKASDG